MCLFIINYSRAALQRIDTIWFLYYGGLNVNVIDLEVLEIPINSAGGPGTEFK